MPDPPDVQLSEHFAAPEWRRRPGLPTTWSAIKNKNPVPCEECAWRQIETHGASGFRRNARSRRKYGRTRLDLCGAHTILWKQRDNEDVLTR